MIAFTRLLLVRWRRTLLGVAPVVLVIVIPGSQAVGMHYFGPSGIDAVRDVNHTAGLVQLCVALVLMIAAFSVANLTAYAVHEERLRARSKLLRVCGVDGAGAAIAFLAAGAILGAIVAVAGLAVPAAVGLSRGVPLTVWLSLGFRLTLLASLFAPIGVTIGFLLPRGLALVVLQVVTIVVLSWPVDMFEVLQDAPPSWYGMLGAVLAVLLIATVALSWLWKIMSVRVW